MKNSRLLLFFAFINIVNEGDHTVKTTFSFTNQDILSVNEYGQCSSKAFTEMLSNVDKQWHPFLGNPRQLSIPNVVL